MNKNQVLFVLLLAGILIKFFLMAVSFHGDLAFIWAIPSSLKIENVFSFYKDYSEKYPDFYESVSTVYYPPISLWFVVFFLPVLKLFSPSLQPWLISLQQMLLSGESQSGKELYINSIHQGIQFDLWLLKAPYFFVDLAIAFVIWKGSDPKVRQKLLLLWWLNPINLYATYMMGQIDIVITFFLALAVLAVQKNNLAGLISALAALMVKTYALAVIPAFYLIKQTFNQLVILAFVSASVIFLAVYPFAKVDSGSIMSAFFPKIMASPFSCGLRPDALWSCGKLLITLAVIFYWGVLFLAQKRLIGKGLFIYLIAGWLALFFFAYRGLIINHYLALVPFLNFIWIKAGKMYKVFAFNLLVFMVFVYVKPLMGELFVPTGVERIIFVPDLRDLVSPWIRYENIAFLARILLDILLLQLSLNSVRKCFIKTV